jgi:excinuclease ABC subunit A
MSVEEAMHFFSSHEKIRAPLELLHEVGVGYLSLGQMSPTLSGGEAQRVKLVAELASSSGDAHGRRSPASALYVLDEPTVGLHMADVDKLLRVLRRLVDAGGTVVVIEHNLDIIAAADWIIDLGPGGGDDGGRIVARGTPCELMKGRKRSHTARYLRQRFSGENRS